jgi:uncharacterized repeat protein (TIGR02059 family)
MKSADGGVLESFGPEKTGADYANCTSAITSLDGKKIELKFNKQMLDPSSELASFRVFVNGVSVGLDSVRLEYGNDSIIEVTLTDAVNGASAIFLSYTAGNITSIDGYELGSFYNLPVANLVPSLKIVSANTSIDGRTIELRFNLPMNDPSSQKAKFSIPNGYSIFIDSVHLMNGNDSIFIFYLSKPVKTGYVLYLTYIPGSLTAQNGQKLSTIWQFSISNNVVTAIMEDKIANETIVFPNPARDYIQVKGNECFSQIIVTNLMGQLIFEKKLKGEDKLVDVSILNEGTYLVTFISCQGENRKTKLIKIK